MNHVLKVAAMLLFLVSSGYSGRAAADGPVHEAIEKVSHWTFEVYQEGDKAEKWIAKEAPKLWEYVQKGEEELRNWCGDHKETCAKEIIKLGEDIGSTAEFVAEELVILGPDILEACALILTAA